jgi:dipeptide/tripeptide permease
MPPKYMGYKRAVVVLAVLLAVGSVLQFFNNKKPLTKGN